MTVALAFLIAVPYLLIGVVHAVIVDSRINGGFSHLEPWEAGLVIVFWPLATVLFIVECPGRLIKPLRNWWEDRR